MKYSEIKSVVTIIHTGAGNPALDLITKLVLGKIARRKMDTRKKIHEITVGTSTSWVISDEIPDFFDFKRDAENNNRCIYFLSQAQPVFLTLTNNSRFRQNTSGGFATKIDEKLVVDFPTGYSTPSILYVPYWSKYLVLDADGTTEKEKPTKDDDTFLLDSIFDDVIVEGILLYLKRRELKDSEWMKAVQEWEKALNSIVFYQ